MSSATVYTATPSSLLPVAQSIAGHWREIGVSGALLARNVDTGAELGFDAAAAMPIASVVKVPLALAVLEAVSHGTLDGAEAVTVHPASSVGPTGISAFQHSATAGIVDLVLLALAVSDNAAADALFERIDPAALQSALDRWGLPGFRVRHRLSRLYEMAARRTGDDPRLALELAVRADAAARHPIETLDVEYTNVASAADCVQLLERVWCDQIATAQATAELRRMMRLQVFHHRLSADLRADTIRVAGKTGTFLNLRHEIGVVESEDGSRVAIAALTRCSRPVAVAHDVDLAIGAAARTVFDALRGAA